MQKNNKKLFARISSVLVACVSALLLCISPFMPKIQPRNMIASADTSSPNYTFDGSNLLISMSVGFYMNGVNLGFSGIGYFLPDISMSRDGFFIDYFGAETQLLSDGSNNIRYFTDSYSSAFVFDTPTEFLMPLPFDSSYMIGWYSIQSGFNFNVYKVQIYSDFDTKPINWTHIKYFDENDNFCDFAFQFYSDLPQDLELEDRTYFLTNSLSDNQIYKSAFDDGFSAGVVKGAEDGYIDGYSEARSVFYNQGYNVGYQDGVNATNTYSFFNLISAVIDAPVQAFMGLFNFELLGVNLADFFLSLLTLCFVVTVVRLLI